MIEGWRGGGMGDRERMEGWLIEGWMMEGWMMEG